MEPITGGIVQDAYEFTGSPPSGGTNQYAYGNPYVFYTPKSSPVTQYSSKYDPFSANFLGGKQPRWENDPSIFDKAASWGWDVSNYLGDYDPQLDDDLSRVDPYSVPGSGIDPKKTEEAKKEAAKAGGATNKTQPNKSNQTDGGGGGGGGGNPPATNDGPTSRPWWHWALLAGAGGLGVWYLSKKKKKGKK